MSRDVTPEGRFSCKASADVAADVFSSSPKPVLWENGHIKNAKMGRYSEVRMAKKILRQLMGASFTSWFSWVLCIPTGVSFQAPAGTSLSSLVYPIVTSTCTYAKLMTHLKGYMYLCTWYIIWCIQLCHNQTNKLSPISPSLLSSTLRGRIRWQMWLRRSITWMHRRRSSLPYPMCPWQMFLGRGNHVLHRWGGCMRRILGYDFG